MWRTGEYTQAQIGIALEVPTGTVYSWSSRNGWPPRPVAAMARDLLPSILEEEVEGGQTIEAVLAAAEGRKENKVESDRERANNQARRKAKVLKRAQDLADKYHTMAASLVHHLNNYMAGTQDRSVVRSVDEEGKTIYLPFHLISKTHGLADGVYRVGMVIEKSLRCDRLAHALEGVDGDGNPTKATGAVGLGDPMSSKTNEELIAESKRLFSLLETPGRLTEVPPGLLEPIPLAAPVEVPVDPPAPTAEAGAQEDPIFSSSHLGAGLEEED